MDIVYYRDPHGNFGDDLNAAMWPRLLPSDVLAAEDAILVGIGSLLNAPQFRKVETVGKRVFVLGTGAAYGRLPEGFRDWTYLAVRGPLTGALIERPEAAATDGAALLATLPELAPVSPRRDAVLFMPHHRTLTNSRWPEAAARAGLEFVDPRWPVERTMEAYGRAELVVAEAMHAAIVADTLRIPWIPLIISPEVSVFKWRDWLGSLELPYRPALLPPSSLLEAQRFGRIRAALGSGGRSVADLDAAAMSDEALLADHAARYGEGGPKVGAAKAPTGIKQLLRPLISAFDGPQTAKAARALKIAAAGEAFLSRDAVFADRLARLEAAKSALIGAIRAG